MFLVIWRNTSKEIWIFFEQGLTTIVSYLVVLLQFKEADSPGWSCHSPRNIVQTCWKQGGQQFKKNRIVGAWKLNYRSDTIKSFKHCIFVTVFVYFLWNIKLRWYTQVFLFVWSIELVQFALIGSIENSRHMLIYQLWRKARCKQHGIIMHEHGLISYTPTSLRSLSIFLALN